MKLSLQISVDTLSWEFIVSTVDDSNLLYPPKVTPYRNVSIYIKISINLPSDHFFWAISFQLSSALSITFFISTQTLFFPEKTYLHWKQHAALRLPLPIPQFCSCILILLQHFNNSNFDISGNVLICLLLSLQNDYHRSSLFLTSSYFSVSSLPSLLSFFYTLPSYATPEPMSFLTLCHSHPPLPLSYCALSLLLASLTPLLPIIFPIGSFCPFSSLTPSWSTASHYSPLSIISTLSLYFSLSLLSLLLPSFPLQPSLSLLFTPPTSFLSQFH